MHFVCVSGVMATQSDNGALEELRARVEELKRTQAMSKIEEVDDRIAALLTLAEGDPPNSEILMMLSNLVTLAQRNGHPKAEFFQELYHGVMAHEDISAAEVVMVALGNEERDLVRIAINKVRKAEEAKARLETARLEEKLFVFE